MIDSLRKKKRILESSDSESVDLAKAPEPLDHSLLPSVDGLPANQRQVLELRYGSDLSFEEIAKRLETTPLNVRQITSRAVKKLRSWLEKDKE